LPSGNGVLQILLRRRTDFHESEGFSGEGLHACSSARETINAQLKSGNLLISASDWLRLDETRTRGNTICLYLSGGTFQELKAVFEKLSEEAEVTDPLKEMFLGSTGH